MKNLLVLLTLFTFASLSLNAQDAKMVTEKVSTVAVADHAAEMDAAVEKRVCAKSGKVSFVKKSVCAKSGKVSYKDVEYCSKSKAFVNVSPSAAKAASCTKSKAACTKSKAACTKKAAGSGAAMKVSSVDGGAAKPACSKSKKGGKACCASKKKAKMSSAAQPAKAIKVSND